MSNDSPEYCVTDSSSISNSTVNNLACSSQLISSKSDGALRDEQLNSSSNSLHNNRVHVDINNSNSEGHLSQYSYFSSSSNVPGDNLQSHNRSSSYSNLSESLSSLYLPQISRQLGSTIMSGLNWINQIEFGSLLQSLVNNTNIFRRRNSSTLNPNTTKSSNANQTISPVVGSNAPQLAYNSNTFQTKTLARLLNGTIKTLKPSELIELSSFGLVELDNVEPGIGHEFQRYENDKATWCDACAEFLSPPVMNDEINSKSGADCATPGTTSTSTGAKSSSLSLSTPAAVQADHLMRTYLQCRKCNYICHLKCHNLIRIDCQPSLSRATSSHSPPQNHLRNTAKSKKNHRHRNSVRFDSLFVDTANPISTPTTTETITEAPASLDSNNNNNDDMTTESISQDSSTSSDSSSHSLQTQSISSPLPSSQDMPDTSDLTQTEEAASSSNDSVFEHNGHSACDDTQMANEQQLVEDDSSPAVNGQLNKWTKTEQQQQSSGDGKVITSGVVHSPTLPELLTPTVIIDLKQKILRYNEKIRGKGSGLGITLIDQQKQLFRGFLRVHMNLTRPINVIAGKRPPSIYDIINEEENQQQHAQRRTLTSFYMPRDTVKNIHITSESTSLQVIKAMLKKFKVVDNPQKFALYLRRRFPEEELQKMKDEQQGNDQPTVVNEDEHNRRFEEAISQFLTPSSYEHSLKRLNDQERPLILQLEFDSFLYGSVDIVLQENDNADIAWDAFEVPELKNFLKILDREENEHLEHVRTHYDELKRVIQAVLEYEEAKTKLIDIKHPNSPDGNQPDSGPGGGNFPGSSNSVVAVES